jgi:holo-[acyl-carrier protein] synthase
MFTSIGTDIVSIKRIKKIYEQYGKKFLERIGIKNDNLKIDEIAGFFAAKEAGYKALKPIKEIFNPKEVEVLKKKGGAPVLVFKGKLKKRWDLLGRPLILLSITHEKEYALAVVVLQKKSNQMGILKGRKKRGKFKSTF